MSAAAAQRECEVFLTLTEPQYRQLGRDIKTLRAETGACSNTEAILAAVRSEAERARARRNGS